MKYNEVSDLTLYYDADKYRELENTLEINKSKDGFVVEFHFLLALLGLKNNRKISLETNSASKENSEQREFSLRTLYPKYSIDMDAYYGLITILDNLEQDYDEVVYNWAFEKTSTNKKSFFELKNVRTFYEYMIGGISILHKLVFSYTNKYRDIADAIKLELDEMSIENNNNDDLEGLLVDL